MSSGFFTNIPHMTNWKGDKLLQPFGPAVFQTHISPEFNKILLDEGKTLSKDKDDFNFELAGNLKTGRSYTYSKEFRKNCEPYIKQKVEDYLNLFIENWGTNGVYQSLEKPALTEEGTKYFRGNISLDSLWINYQRKNDHNPLHNHSGLFSFVIYLQVPQEIFSENADCNHQKAGCILFDYGEAIIPMMSTSMTITPYDNLMMIFPAKLKHQVPSFWVDAERISVSGNFNLI